MNSAEAQPGEQLVEATVLRYERIRPYNERHHTSKLAALLAMLAAGTVAKKSHLCALGQCSEPKYGSILGDPVVEMRSLLG